MVTSSIKEVDIIRIWVSIVYWLGLIFLYIMYIVFLQESFSLNIPSECSL